jgi:tripartite-type tricarboxylate transporter receptor subunit TctC
MFHFRRAFVGLLALGACFAATPLAAQTYPSKPLRLVVPFPPGGPTDLIGRLLGQKLSEALGQPVVVDNRAGAGGTIGSEAVAKSPADGYTLLYGSTSTLAISPSVYKALSYNPATAFAPVALVSRGQQILVANPQLPITSMRDLVAYAKANPTKTSYSSAGNGTPGHLAAELLKQVTGMPALHVPYKGGAPALQATLAGEVQFTVDVVPTSLPHIKAGKLRALAVLSTQRSAVLPDVPTVDQAGFKPVSADFWSGVVAPAGTPATIVQRLNAEIRKIVGTPEFRARLAEVGADPQQGTAQEFAAFIDREMRKWASVAQSAGVKLDN